MKRFIVFGLSLFLLFSCDVGDDGPDFNLELLPIESVEIPDEFELGEVYPITVRYFKPSTCHTFREFYYLKENNERTVAVINYEYLNNSCEELENELVEATFNFIVTSNGSYIFKFWQGENTDGENEYLTIEVPVID